MIDGVIDFEESLLDCIEKNDWKTVLHLGNPNSEIKDENLRRKYLWFWPTEESITFIGNLMAQRKIRNILSIGCGSGLLEWLIEKSTDIRVTGVEVDESWWKSKYSPNSFIPLKYVADQLMTNFYSTCFDTERQFSLMFCYFNNRSAFLEYVKFYTGNIIIIIGPDSHTSAGRHTDPLPLFPQFEKDEWYLYDVFRLNIDVIAVYTRLKNK